MQTQDLKRRCRIRTPVSCDLSRIADLRLAHLVLRNDDVESGRAGPGRGASCRRVGACGLSLTQSSTDSGRTTVDALMPETPRLELLETRWRVRDPHGRALTCGIYLSDTGYDVRSEYSADQLVRSQWARDVDAARRIADGWLRALREQGDVEELLVPNE